VLPTISFDYPLSTLVSITIDMAELNMLLLQLRCWSWYFAITYGENARTLYDSNKPEVNAVFFCY
jgi:hypothetical protein